MACSHDFLPEQDLRSSLESLTRSIPDLASQADFALENVRESLMWVRPCFRENKAKSFCLAKTIAALTSFRCALTDTTFKLKDADQRPYNLYSRDTEILTMHESLLQLPGAAGEHKLREIQSALQFLTDLHPNAGPLTKFFAGSFACLADVLPHLEKIHLMNQKRCD